MDTLNWTAILLLSVAFLGLWAFWFGPLFGRVWMKIHGMEKKTKKEMEELQKGMGKLIASEFVSVFLTVMTLDFLISILPQFSGMHVGFFVWIGFVLPTYVTATAWGGDDKKWMFLKVLITAGYRLIMLLVSGYVLAIW